MNVTYTKEAIKHLDKLRLSNLNVRERIVKKIQGITQWNVLIEKMSSHKNYKARVGKYRMIYQIENGELLIVIMVVKRGKVYNKR